MNLGPKTKAAIRRIVDTLPYIQAEDAVTPTGLRGDVTAIRIRTASKSPTGVRDPRFEAANDWAEEELSKALDEDASEKPTEPPVEEQPALEPAPEPSASVVHGGVTLEPQPEPEPIHTPEVLE